MDNPRNFYRMSRLNIHSYHMVTRCVIDLSSYLSVIQNYHINKDIFMPTIGKALQSQRELNNDCDSFTVAIMILSLP